MVTITVVDMGTTMAEIIATGTIMEDMGDIVIMADIATIITICMEIMEADMANMVIIGGKKVL